MASCDQHLKISFNGAASCINARDEDALIASLAESGTSKSGVSAPAPAPAPGGVGGIRRASFESQNDTEVTILGSWMLLDMCFACKGHLA